MRKFFTATSTVPAPWPRPEMAFAPSGSAVAATTALPEPAVVPESAVAASESPDSGATAVAAPLGLSLSLSPLEPARIEPQSLDSCNLPVSDDSSCADINDDTDRSIAGDAVCDSLATVNEDAAEIRRHKRFAPKTQVQGNFRSRGSSEWRPEDWNFRLLLGNWGIGGTRSDWSRRDIINRQIMNFSAEVLVICEATQELDDMLRQPPVEGTAVADGTAVAEGLHHRPSHEHWVVRGDEQEAALLIAARKDTCTYLECLEYDVHSDHVYRQLAKNKFARSRTLVCRVQFQQNIGYLGKDFVVCGVHGHYMTMKHHWPSVLKQFWDGLCNRIRKYDIKFVAGDFNMSVTEVVKELTMRGIECNCVAWYPWCHKSLRLADQPLGFDSCAIFYIGGKVQVRMPWSLQHIDILTAVAAEVALKCKEREDGMQLDWYEGPNCPGYHGQSYRSRGLNESNDEKDLKQTLINMLTPSRTQEWLDAFYGRKWGGGYLRLKQKAMDKKEWMGEAEMLNGAHFPLCVFTNNHSARSETMEMERDHDPHSARNRSAVAADVKADPASAAAREARSSWGTSADQPTAWHDDSGWSWSAGWSWSWKSDQGWATDSKW